MAMTHQSDRARVQLRRLTLMLVQAICDIRDHEVRCEKRGARTTEERLVISALFGARFSLNDALLQLRVIETAALEPGPTAAAATPLVYEALRLAALQLPTMAALENAAEGAERLIGIVTELRDQLEELRHDTH